jgi:hypothetical protein
MSFSGRKPKLRTWEQESGGWEYRTPNLRIMVHGYIGMPDNAWFLTCYDLRIERMPLAATDAETAKAEGLASVMGWVRKLSAELGISAPTNKKSGA